MRILLSGSSGSIGSTLLPALKARGHVVWPLVRRPTAPGEEAVQWIPDTGALDASALARLGGVEAVVHLAGEPLVGLARWDERKLRAIRSSRVEATAALVRTLLALRQPPTTLLSASAVGYYGSRGDEVLTESSPAGTDLLARLCVDWEGATAPAANAGTRVVLLRSGIAMTPGSGALSKMLPPFRMGLGGPLGSGKQWLAWISLPDLVSAVLFCLDHTSLSGPMNLCGPTPATNAEFSLALGKVLRRPAVLPAPAIALRLLMGEAADLTLLASQRASPERLQRAGFVFQHPTAEEALRAVLGAP
jgi:uncharacterized protein (TIGR01777 family)